MKMSALILGTKMNFLKRQLWSALLLSACVWMLPASDVAAQGSWGGSFGGGGLGSGGSWGGSSGGLLGGRRPIANLFSRVGDRLRGFGSSGGGGFGSSGGGGFGSSGGGLGSGGSGGGSTGLSGGSSGGGFLRGGLLSRVFGRRSGFGSSGGSGFGSSGGSNWGGSNGGSNWGGSNWGGSSGSFVSTSDFSSTDFVSAAIHEPSYAPVETSYNTLAPYSNFSMEQSFPVGDQGLDPNYPVYESYAGGNVIGGTTLEGAFGGSFTPTNTPLVDDTFNGQPTPAAGSNRIEDGGSIDGMLDSAPIETEPYYDSSPIDQVLPNPGPSGDSTNLTAPLEGADFVGADRAVLRLKVPEEAKVYVNGRLTKTPGAVRSFESSNLVAGRVYKYKVKAVIQRDGKQLVRSKLVSLQTGTVHDTSLDFDAPATTVLALNVPKDATVKLCGKETSLDGLQRRYATTRLADGEVCEDYSIEVSYRVDGELVKQVRKIDLAAGDFRTLTFDGEVTEQVAKR